MRVYQAFDLAPVGDQSWREQALCAKLVMDNPLLATLWDEDGTESQIKAAIEVCLMCAVRAECLNDAVRTPAYGVRGGKRTRSRRELRYA